jgi:putative ABC transport system substrate-binding protein
MQMSNRRKLVIALGASAFVTPSWSLAQAPVTKPARIGLLGPGAVASGTIWAPALVANLRDHGYVEGTNLSVESRWAEGNNDRLADLAAELVRLNVDVIVTFQTPAAVAAKRATTTIPIVMAAAADPVGTGLVASLARPGGNVTGISSATAELAAKNLELILQIVPSAKHVAVLVNAADTFAKTFLEQNQLAARSLGIELRAFTVRSGEPQDAAFEEVVKARVSALIVQPSLPHQRAIELAVRHRLAASSPGQGFADAGGLVAYTQNIAERDRQAALYVVRILNGAKPADLPVLQPVKFELVINLKTAKRIGLTIPPAVLARADRVIT